MAGVGVWDYYIMESRHVDIYLAIKQYSFFHTFDIVYEES